ncbi:MAG TPA: inositol monophosphatase family protein [Thermoanaerobaculia bacterium]
MTWLRELDLALELAVTGGEEALRLYAELPAVADPPADLTTAADLAVQTLLVAGLRRAFPGDGILAEEATGGALPSPAESPRHWAVDPIDGTRGFARKNGEFALQVALVAAGEPVVAVVYEPVPERLTWATRDGGCWVCLPGRGRPARCRVSDAGERPRLAVSRARPPDEVAALAAAFAAAATVRTYSAGIKLALVARGECDVYLGDYLALADWDVAPGHLLVAEAGGRVTDAGGRAIRYDGSGRSLAGRGLLASNGRLHVAALAAVAAGRVPVS